jgi:acyl-CoA reductase-like NAD-dependent aldehyde dehydrogenase
MTHRIVLPAEGVTAVPIAGEPATGTESSQVGSPFSGQRIGDVPLLGQADVDRAVAAAKSALHNEPLPPWRRAEILDRAAALLRERQEEFAQIIAQEAAKPIKTARVEADRAIGTFTFAAVEARKLAGEVIPIQAAAGGDTKVAYTMRVPIGVVGAISPFNFPLNLVAHRRSPPGARSCSSPPVRRPSAPSPLPGC